MNRGTVLIAMSGGVDSSVGAALLRDQGYGVIGATLKLWCYGETAPDGKTCCSLDDIADARRVAGRLGIRHLVLDMEADFEAQVVSPFVASYLAGQTPNPCVACNTHLKFGRLLEFADQLGADFVATGHHARRVTGPEGEPAIARATDRAKDQSYALWGVPRAALERVLLPTGELDKVTVRRTAADLGLPVAAKPESQDICFVQGGRYADFVRARSRAPEPGPIVDQEGRVLGRHEGILDFTVGQRRGLGVGGGARLYVTGIDAATATVRVGPREALAACRLTLSSLNRQRPRPLAAGETLAAQIRGSAPAVPAVVEAFEPERVRLRFQDPVLAVVPGQSGVLYDGDRVVAGGVIVPGPRGASD